MTTCTRIDAHSIGECPNYPEVYFAADPNGGWWVYVDGEMVGYRRTMARAYDLAGIQDPHEEHRSSRTFDPDCTGCEKDAYDSFVGPRED